jgi:hypothetical protein
MPVSSSAISLPPSAMTFQQVPIYIPRTLPVELQANL